MLSYFNVSYVTSHHLPKTLIKQKDKHGKMCISRSPWMLGIEEDNYVSNTYCSKTSMGNTQCWLDIGENALLRSWTPSVQCSALICCILLIFENIWSVRMGLVWTIMLGSRKRKVHWGLRPGEGVENSRRQTKLRAHLLSLSQYHSQ